jgi:VWFA-related protein
LAPRFPSRPNWRQTLPRTLATLFAAFSPLASSVAFAQQSASPSADSGQPVVKVATRLVVLSVVVTDKTGNPITGLTKDDFRILENDQPQAIASFEPAAEFASSAAPEPAATPALPDVNAPPQAALVLDQLNTKSEDLMFAAEEIRAFLRAQPPHLSQPTSLYSLTKRGLELLATPTQDRDSLLAVFKKSIVELPPHTLESGGVQGGADRLLAALLALDEMALSSAHQKGRKNIIWIGNGIPILSAGGVDLSNRARFLDWVHYTVNWLQESQTTVYTVDPRGLEVAPETLALDFGSAIVPQTGLTLSDLVFESLAPESGGAIFRRRNDVDVAIATALRDGFSSYTLSYYPRNNKWDSAFRSIRVVVNGTGLTARTQRGYYAFPEGFEGGTAQIDFGLSRAVTSPIPFRSVAFTATAQILPPPSAQTVLPPQKLRAAPHVAKGPATSPMTFRLILAINRDSLSWAQQPNGDQRSEITVVTSCIGSSGRVLGYRVREAELILEKSKLQDPASDSIQLFVRMDLPSKTDHVRLVVRDAASSHLGTFDLPSSSLTRAPVQ